MTGYNTTIERKPGAIIVTAVVMTSENPTPRRIRFISRDDGITWKQLSK